MSDHLVDMKRSKKDRKSDEAVSSSHEKFPYGLSINLEDESLTKLGFKNLPKVGTKVKVVAEGVVTSVNTHERSGGKPSRNIAIQLEKMSVKGPKSTAVDAVTEAIKDA